MTNAPKSSTHPLIIAAAGAVVLVSGLGAAAIMGWLPSSAGHNTDANGQPIAAQTAAAPGASTPSSAPVLVKAAEPVQHHAAATHHHAPAQTASAAPAICNECGVVASVNEVDTKGQGSGVGAVGGAVVGGLLGNQVGSGHGRQLATIAGAIGGAVAGNQIEGKVKSTKSYDISVRLNDGSQRVFHQAELPAWHEGDHVRVVDGVLRSAD